MMCWHHHLALFCALTKWECGILNFNLAIFDTFPASNHGGATDVMQMKRRRVYHRGMTSKTLYCRL